MTEESHIQHLWVCLTSGDKLLRKVAEFKPGDEPVLRFELPYTKDIAQLNRLTAFSTSNRYGSWSSPTYECSAVRSGVMVLQELDEEGLNMEHSPPPRNGRRVICGKGVETEVVGDVENMCRSPPTRGRQIARGKGQ